MLSGADVETAVSDTCTIGELVGEGGTVVGQGDGVEIAVRLGVGETDTVSSGTDSEAGEGALDVGRGVGTYSSCGRSPAISARTRKTRPSRPPYRLPPHTSRSATIRTMTDAARRISFFMALSWLLIQFPVRGDEMQGARMR